MVLLDGLIASAAPEVLVPHARRLRQVVLVHMPLGDRRESAVLEAAAAVVTTSAWTRRRLGELYELPAGLGPVAQRHVHEHDLPQPARVRHEHVGGGGRDQPVEQHRGAVRDPSGGTRERGEPRLPRPRPRAGHGVLAHRPAEHRQPPADAAVVRVAAARPRRVVDALGNDDVDLGHSGRS